MTINNAAEVCLVARNTLREFSAKSHNDSILKMSLEGMIEIENGVLDNFAAEQAARHVSGCNPCTQ